MISRKNSHKVFRLESTGETVILTPQDDSLGTQEADLEREIDALHEMFDEPRVMNLVVDIGSSPYFGSIVIGAIMALCKKVHDKGGRAIFCNASDGMRDVIRIMKLDTVMPYFTTRDEALEALKSQPK